jgi:GDPmannose 4,6-dehydratase
MAKAIIFGISGMDAKSLTHILLGKNYDIVGTYRRNTLNVKLEIHPLFDNNPRLTFDYCDVNDFTSVKELLARNADVNEIYLLAAQSNVGFSFSSPSVSAANGMSVFNVLENVKNLCPKAKTYFAATSELFGGKNPEVAYDEDSIYDCRSPYSVGKEMGTRWVKYYRQLGLFVCYGVLFNHSCQYRGLDFYIRRVTNSAARISVGKQDKLSLGNLNFYRDEHWSDFSCEMMFKMLQRESPKDYVIATGKTWHGEQYLDEAFGYFNLKWQDHVEIDKTRFRPNEVEKLIGNSSLAQKELGWRTDRMPFKDHISLMCKYDYELESGKVPVRPDVFSLYP